MRRDDPGETGAPGTLGILTYAYLVPHIELDRNCCVTLILHIWLIVEPNCVLCQDLLSCPGLLSCVPSSSVKSSSSMVKLSIGSRKRNVKG